MRSRYSISRFVEGLSPYQSLFVVGVPLAIVEPLKLVALFIVGDGHFIAGVVVMICAYGGSLFVTEQLFIILKPKLLTLPWFAKDLELVCPYSQKAPPMVPPKMDCRSANSVWAARKAMKSTSGADFEKGCASQRHPTDREPLLDQRTFCL